MAEGPYVHERQTEYWTSRQIEEHFLNAAFEVLTFPLTQHTERRIPADFIFFDTARAKLHQVQLGATAVRRGLEDDQGEVAGQLRRTASAGSRAFETDPNRWR